MPPDVYPYEQENELQKAFRNYPYELKKGDYFILISAVYTVYYVVSVVPFWKRTEQGSFIYWLFVIKNTANGFEIELSSPPSYSRILPKEEAEVLYGV